MSDAPTFRCAGCGIVYSTQENASRCARGDVIRQCDCGECDECYRRRIATLEARIAELEREREDWETNARVVSEGASERISRLTAELVAARADMDDAVGLLGMDTAWPLADVLERLARASRHMLRAHDCGCLGWEVIHAAYGQAYEYIGNLRAYLARHPTPDKETT